MVSNDVRRLGIFLINKPMMRAYLKDILEHPCSTRKECAGRIGEDIFSDHTCNRAVNSPLTRDCINRTFKTDYCEVCGHALRRHIAYSIRPECENLVRDALAYAEEA